MSLSNIYLFIYMLLLRCSCEHLNIPVVKISQNKFISIFLWTSSPYEDNQKLSNLFLFVIGAWKLLNCPHVAWLIVVFSQ